MAQPSVQAALEGAETRREQFVQEWIELAEIPAPSGSEARRAAHVERRFNAIGLEAVGRDGAGNVLGLMRGKDRTLPKVAFMAHLDTVAPEAADHTVKRIADDRGGVLRGPGIRDDSSGLAALLAAATLLRGHGLEPPADTWFVASTREEIGLQGASRFFDDHAAELGAFIAVDGNLGQVSWAATGIVWLKLWFRGEGAHTLKAHEMPSTILAAARAIEEIAAIPLRRSPESMETWLGLGSMGGGQVPNAQPSEAWFTVDLRSNDPGQLAALERKVRDLAGQAARKVGVELEVETMQRMAGAEAPGAESSQLVVAARQVLEALSWNRIELTRRGTADHNVAILRGIPGIAIGITTGDGAHTPEEHADIAPFTVGLKQVVLLVLMPLTKRA